MKNVTKRFVAAVLVLAMLISATGFTASASSDFTLRDPETPVSLQVRHTEGLLPTGTVVNPDGTGFPTGREPVVGATWRMIRVHAPAVFTPELHTPPPATADGLSTLPRAVRLAIVAGSFGTPLADGRRPITTPSGNIPGSDPPEAFPAVPAGWYVSSNVAANSAFGGALQAVTDAAGIANFNATMIQNSTTAATDLGHGMWLVWEHYVDGPTEQFDIIPPFLVNLPTFFHPGAGDDHDCDEDCRWIYDVVVFPSDLGDEVFDKDFTNATIGVDPATGQEYTVIDWRIRLQYPADIGQMPNLPADRFPTGSALPAGQYARILIHDTLDSRINLMLNTHNGAASGSPLPFPWVGRHGTYHINVTIHERNAPLTDPGTPLATEHWHINHTTTADGAALPVPFGMPAATADGAQQTFWVHIRPSAVPFLLAGDLADEGGEIRVNFRTVAHHIQVLDDMGNITNNTTHNTGNRPSYDLATRHPERVPSVQLHSLQVNKINNNNVALNGAVFFLLREDQVSVEMVNGVPVASRIAVYPAGHARAGEAVVPYRIAISGGLAGSTILAEQRPAGTGLVVAGTVVGVTDAVWNLVSAKPATTPAPAAGQAIFYGILGSDTGARYWLYEVAAPVGYNRVTTLTPFTFTDAACTLLADATHECNDPTSSACVFPAGHHVNNRDFTNYRDFRLPMTGGAGTLMFTTAGVSLMGIAGLFLFLSRKKDKAKVVRSIQ
jgi:LPXTG-motif cell wall-anchored protein